MKRKDLNFDGGLITHQCESGEGRKCCLGFLFVHHGNAYDAEYGRIDGVTEEEAVAHNLALDRALIDGLDNNCPVGKGSDFYLKGESRITPTVSTWIGTIVGTAMIAEGTKQTYVMKRKGMTFRGSLHKRDDQYIFFKRVA
jgi:hypothetical protein